MTAVWDDPETNAVWDKHAAETYYSYWEQYSYWAAQGWTTDQSLCNGNADGVMDGGIETLPEECRDGQTEAEVVTAPHDDLEVLKAMFGQNCTLEAGGSSASDSEIDRRCVRTADDGKQSKGESCGTDDPADGGNDRKRPAASSQQNTAEHTGSS